MYISYNWLKNYLPELDNFDPKDIADNLSNALAEVEQIEEKGIELKNIVVGEIIEVNDHPNNEKLKIAEVDTGDKIRKIVFAGENQKFVQPKSLYPVCLPGGAIYNPKDPFGKQSVLKIEEKEVNKIKSEGVLCSPKELGLFDEKTGITIIHNDMNKGDDLLPLLQDKIFEIENKSLTHRPDCFSHRGIARELSAILQTEFVDKEEPKQPVKIGDKKINISDQISDNTRRFVGIVMDNINIQPSPTWMKIGLSNIGLRPINVIVDISNYIMMDIGYPSHMYDYDQINNGKLIIRNAKSEEKFSALNEQSYELDNTMAVITDDKKIHGIASVMGGADSEIKDKTNSIIIEAGTWDMYNIRRTSMKLGLNTDASVRAAKGIDSIGQYETVLRIIELIEEYAEGEVSSELIDINNERKEKKKLEFDLKMIKKIIGVTLNKEEILNILESLKIEIEGEKDIPIEFNNSTSNTIIQLTIPYYRRDLNIPEDICEEVARIYGYRNLKPTLPQRQISVPKINSDLEFIRTIRTLLTTTGLNEIYTYSFTNKSIYEKCGMDISKCIRIKNPLSPDLEYLRNHILPNHIEKIELNIPDYNQFGFFEISRVITKEINDESLPIQPREISGLYFSKDSSNTFQKLKSKIYYLFDNYGLHPEIENLNSKKLDDLVNLFHPTKTGVIKLNQKILGYIGFIHPRSANQYKIDKYNTVLFNLNYEILKEQVEKTNKEFTKIPTTPHVTRDINIHVAKKSEIGYILDELKSLKIDNIETISIKSIFEKKEFDNITLTIKLRNPKDTMEEKGINNAIKEILSNITQIDTSISIPKEILKVYK